MTLVRRVVVALLLALVLTGCGSQLDPSAVASANSAVLAPPAGGPTPGNAAGDLVAGSALPVGGRPGEGRGGGAGRVAGEESGAAASGAPGGDSQGPAAAPGATGLRAEATGDPAPDRPPTAASQESAAVPSAPSAEGATCDGFSNQTGITDDDITIANASDISGPVPGLFQSTQDAVEAYAAYFNATSTICGRHLKVLPIDTRTDAGGDQQAYVEACGQAFAAVGSMAAFDSGGAAAAQSCGLPDLRSAIVNGARNACTTCFAAQSGTPDTSADAVPDYLLQTYHEASTHAGYLYIQAGPAVENATDEIKAWQSRGMHFAYVSPIDVTEFNYAPYVEALKEHGVGLVRFLGSADEAVRLAHAMTQQHYEPQVFLIDATAYDQTYVNAGGADVEGTRVFVNFAPFADASHNAEMSLYLRWLQEVKPGATPSYDGLFAWSAARLFTERAAALGGRLSRPTMVRSLRHVRRWTDHGLHAPQQVGSHVVGPCWRFLRLQNGHWVPEGGTDYRCGAVSRLR